VSGSWHASGQVLTVPLVSALLLSGEETLPEMWHFFSNMREIVRFGPTNGKLWWVGVPPPPSVGREDM
jgi:hypothetical protein